MQKPTEIKIEDTNMAAYNSKEATEARVCAASQEKEFKGAGAKAGIEVWRIKNLKRTEKKGPKFGVEKQKNFGLDPACFYAGDSYVIMHTMEDKKTGKKSYDIHFWLGKDSTQDEIGVAAYKTVELDTLLGDVPVQYRELQGYESAKFLKLFKGYETLEGGYDSGFTKVKPEEYKPRLCWVRRSWNKKTMLVSEVKLSTDSLNDGDAFILDAGTKIFQFNGKTADPFEKRKALEISKKIESSRFGKAKWSNDCDKDSDFWKILGGYTDKIKPAISEEDKKKKDMQEAKRGGVQKCELWKCSDESGKIMVSLVSKTPKWSDVHSKDVWFLDLGVVVMVLVGKECSKNEKRSAMVKAIAFLKSQGKPATCSLMAFLEGKNDGDFKKAIEAGCP